MSRSTHPQLLESFNGGGKCPEAAKKMLAVRGGV